MFPLRDDIPSPRFPFVLLLIIALNIVVFYLEWKMGPDEMEAFIMQHAIIPSRDLSPFLALAGGESLLSWIRPYFSSMFLHGGLLHLLSNLWSLWIFGDNVEGRMGPIRFLIFYILCGLAAGFTHSILNPESALPVVGASGAISGVMGAYLFLFPRARLHMFTILIFYPLFFEMPAIIFLVIWFFGQLMSGTADLAAQQAAGVRDVGGIAFFAHIGGFLAGIFLLPFLKGPRPKKTTIWA